MVLTIIEILVICAMPTLVVGSFFVEETLDLNFIGFF
jgi:hypothetical protein